MSMLDELEAEASGERPSFLTKDPKFSLDELEAEAAAKPAPKGEYAALKEDLAASRAENAKPTALDAAYAGLRKGASFGFSDELEAAHHRLSDLITGPSAGDVVTGKAGKTYSQYRDEARARDAATAEEHPYAAMAGETAGGLATSVIPGLGPSTKAAAGWREVAKAGAKGGALYGAGESTADLTKGDVGGMLRDSATGALTSAATGAIIGKAVRGAPERVDERVIKSINLGDDTNSKLSTARKVMARAGEHGEDLLDMLEGSPLKKVFATKAASDPRAAEKLVGKRLTHLTDQTDPLYQAIGDVDVASLDAKLQKAGAGFVADGKAAMAGAVEKARANLAKLYGKDGVIPPGTVLPARSVRNYANEVGEVAFAGDPTASPKVRARAQQYLYREITDAIADAGTKSGADVGKLRSLNKEISTLIPVRQALTERAVQKEAGRQSLSETIKHAALPALGAATGMGTHGAHGGLTGLATGAAAYGAAKASKPLARAADWQLAKLVQAARNGSKPAQLGQLAIELGLSRTVAEEIAKVGIGAMSQPE